MRIRITVENSIFGIAGAIPVGTEITVDAVPASWAGRCEIVSEMAQDAVLVVGNDRDALKAKADELGIEYAKNIPTEKLKELIDAKSEA